MFGHEKPEKIEEFGEKKNLKKLIPLCSSRDTETRAAVAKALQHIDTDDSYNQLIAMIRDPEIAVQKAAVSSLGVICRQSAAEHIHHVMNTASDAELKEACRKALSSITDHGSR